ncbi:hypothetical protein GCM10009550_40950 [Actinocorallia libanotica]|uniref:Uncharacterized protein n=1 Tax=Actinocorallia libanotica TaxID=46162 RepID=A0ABN1REG3_9ACTN
MISPDPPESSDEQAVPAASTPARTAAIAADRRVDFMVVPPRKGVGRSGLFVEPSGGLWERSHASQLRAHHLVKSSKHNRYAQFTRNGCRKETKQALAYERFSG